MEEPIIISNLNDFIFCPASIYFHQLYGVQEKITYQCSDQLRGTHAHKTVDNKQYSTRKDVLQGVSVYSEKYNLIGKIDVFDVKTGILTERKKKIKTIYDGYVFQIYAQYFALIEMGYTVKALRLYSMDDNTVYPVPMPDQNISMFEKFQKLLNDMNDFTLEEFRQTNCEKCRHCIYETACDRSAL